ncbi:MAG TPA: S4 domain-containing protein [Patescibacteria group bacterium]|nr:S4 domain-containing protein [Patescibacteria group bacterium]
MLERLQKIIAQAGVTSRRRAEDLIVSGQVEVNGKVVSELGSKADPEQDAIRVAGKVLRPAGRRISLALNKPDACVSSLSDPAGRATLKDYLGGVAGRVFPVGRLEYHSTGLVLLTSDGAFAARLFRALGGGLVQTYQIKIKRPLSAGELATIARRVCPIRVWRPGPNPWYEVRLTAARQDRLRNLLFEMEHPVEKIKRVAIGPVELDETKPGRWRALSLEEVRALEEEMTRLSARASRPRRKKASKRGKPAA